MAGPFNIVAQLQLQAPTNLNTVVSDIQRKLSGITATVDIRINSSTLNVLQSLNSQLATLQSNLQATERQATATASSLSRIGGSYGSVGSAAASANASLAATSPQMRAIMSSTQQATSSMENFGIQAGLAARRYSAFLIAGGAIVTFANELRNAFGEALKFERQMVRLGQIGNTTASDIKGIENEITRLATTWGSSSQQLAGVAVQLRQAGLSAGDTRMALDALAKTALAPSFGNLEDTTEGLVAALNQFKLSASDAEKVLGAINAVSTNYAVSSHDIIDAIRRTGGAFHAAGGNLNELIGLFGAVRSTSRESSESIGSALRTIFVRVQRASVVEDLRHLGVELRYTREEAQRLGRIDLAGQFVGPYQAIKRVSEALSTIRSTDPRFAALTEELGGYRQISKIIPLMQEFGKAQSIYQTAQQGSNSLTKSAEQAQEAFLVRLQKVREEFLALIRTITQSKGMQVFLDMLIQTAHALNMVAGALTPLIPLLGAIATFQLARGVGPMLGGLVGGFGGRSPRFAGGGVVPGAGDTDSVYAHLTPGEFVIRKQAAKAIGYDTLEQVNKYAEGGPALRQGRSFRVGYNQHIGLVAREGQTGIFDDIVDPNKISRRGKYPPAIESYAQELVKTGVSARDIPNYIRLRGRVERSVLSEQRRNEFQGQVVDVVQQHVRDIFASLPPLRGQQQPELSKQSLRTLSGPLFESYITRLTGKETTDPNSPFDFVGLSGRVKRSFSKLFSPTIRANYLDAKSTSRADTAYDVVKKGLNEGLFTVRPFTPIHKADGGVVRMAEGGDPEKFYLGIGSTEHGMRLSATAAAIEQLRSAKGAEAMVHQGEAGIRMALPGRSYGQQVTSQANKLAKFEAESAASSMGFAGKTVYVPYTSDRIGIISKDSVNEAGLDRVLTAQLGDLSGLGKGVRQSLQGQGISRVQGKVNKHVLSVSAAHRFDNEIGTKVAGAISNVFKSEFQESKHPFKLDPLQLKTIDGYLLEQYVGALGNTIPAGGGAHFDFAGTNKVLDRPGLRKLLYPSPITSNLVEIKNSAAGEQAYTVLSKYLNLMGGQIGKTGQILDPRLQSAKKAAGGRIDSIPALLTPGEYIINRDAAQHIGYANLEAMNRSGIARFATGGTVVGGWGAGMGEPEPEPVKRPRVYGWGRRDRPSTTPSGSNYPIGATSPVEWEGRALAAGWTPVPVMEGENTLPFAPPRGPRPRWRAGPVGEGYGIGATSPSGLGRSIITQGLNPIQAEVTQAQLTYQQGMGGGLVSLQTQQQVELRELNQIYQRRVEEEKKALLDSKQCTSKIEAERVAIEKVNEEFNKLDSTVMQEVRKQAETAGRGGIGAVLAKQGEEASGLPMTSMQRLRGGLGNFGRQAWANRAQIAEVGAGMAAMYGGQFFERQAGTAEQAVTTGSTTGYQGEKAIGGALQGAAMGAGIGMFMGPWGVAIGAAIGAVGGFTTALQQAAKDITEARVSLGNTKISEVSKLATGRGMTPEVTKALREQDVTLQEQEAENAPSSLSFSGLNKFGLRATGGIMSMIRIAGSGGLTPLMDRKFDVNPFQHGISEIERGEDVARRARLAKAYEPLVASHLPRVREQMEKEYAVTPNATPAEFFKGFERRHAEELGAMYNVPETREKLVAGAKEIQVNQVEATNASRGTNMMLQNFEAMNLALRGAVSGLGEFSRKMNAIDVIFTGQIAAAQVKNPAENINLMGLPGSKEFMQSVRQTAAPFGAQGQQFVQTGEALTNVRAAALAAFPNALKNEGNDPRSIQERLTEAITTKLGGTQAIRGTPTEIIINDFKAKLEAIGKGPGGLAGALQTNAGGVIQGALGTKGDYERQIEEAGRLQQQAAQAVANASQQFEQRMEAVGKMWDEAAKIGTQAAIIIARTQGELGHAEGTATYRMPLAQLEESYNAEQRRLGGVGGLQGQAAFDPTAIAARQREVHGQIMANVEYREKNPFNKQAIEDYSKLTRVSNNLAQAQDHLTHITERNAGIEEHLGALRKDEATRLGMTQKWLTADPRQRAQMMQGSQFLDMAVRQGNFNSMTPQMMQSIMSMSNDTLYGNTKYTNAEMINRLTAATSGIPEAFAPGAHAGEMTDLAGRKIANARTGQLAAEQKAGTGEFVARHGKELGENFANNVDTQLVQNLDTLSEEVNNLAAIMKAAAVQQAKIFGVPIETEPEKHAGGGAITGQGGIDTIPAMLTHGEYVVNAQSARANFGLLEAINKSGGQRLHMQAGGPVAQPNPLWGWTEADMINGKTPDLRRRKDGALTLTDEAAATIRAQRSGYDPRSSSALATVISNVFDRKIPGQTQEQTLQAGVRAGIQHAAGMQAHDFSTAAGAAGIAQGMGKIHIGQHRPGMADQLSWTDTARARMALTQTSLLDVGTSIDAAVKQPGYFQRQRIAMGLAAPQSVTAHIMPTPHFASGGLVDTTPALLTAGEFVINAKSARNIGYNNLQRLNAGGPVGNDGFGNTTTTAPAMHTTPSAGGVGNFTQDVGRLQSVFTTFASTVSNLTNALAKIPPSIQLSGNYNLNVSINGADAFKSMEGTFKEMVTKQVDAAINNFIQQRFPEIGRMNAAETKPVEVQNA